MPELIIWVFRQSATVYYNNGILGNRGTSVYISLRTSIRRKYGSIPKKDSRVVLILGIVLFFTSLMLIPSTVISIHHGEKYWPFAVPAVIGIVLSLYMILKYRLPNDIRPADGLMMMFSVWILLFLFGTLPFLFSGFSLTDAIFESVSGFSTTGATIITDVEAAPSGILLWRAISNWIGGIIIVMMFMFIIPMVVSGGRGLLKNEMSGSGGGNLTVKLGSAARQFIIMYAMLTAIFTLILYIQNVSLLDSVTIAMSSISIGGFLNTNDSMASYSMMVKISVIVFMLISASNFYLHYRALFKGDFRGYRRSEEFRIMILWFMIISLFMLLQAVISDQWNEMGGSDGDKIVDIIFSIVSVGTTSGFSTVDFTSKEWWSFVDLSLFMILMFIGGSAGSTSGGVKISRVIITVKSLFNEIRQEVHPNAVYTVRYDGNVVPKEVVHSAMVVVTAFLIVTGVGAALFNIIMGLDDAVYLSVAMVTNTGTGSGSLFSNYEDLPIWAKYLSCILMFLGRMEILAILAVFTPGFWLEFVGRSEINRTKEKFLVITRIREFRKKKRSQNDDRLINEVIEDDGPMEITESEAEAED